MARIIVVGGVAAGMSAASKAKRIHPAHEVVVYTDEDQVSYAACGFPYYAEGILHSLVKRKPEQFREAGIELHMGHRVTSFDPATHTLTIESEDGAQLQDRYDKLVLATGARPIRPPIPGIDLPAVHTVNNYADIINLTHALRNGNVKNVAIIGGGFIGVEMADALHALGMQVSIVEMASQLLTNLDADLADLVREHYAQNGVSIHTGEAASAIEQAESGLVLHTPARAIQADIILSCVGLVPNSELAAAAGAELGVRKAVRVNERLETTLPDVYAAGDCATATHMLSGAEVWIPLGTTANKQGRAAGENAAGGDASFPGVLGSSIFKAMELEGSRTGLSKTEAEKAGFAAWEYTTTADTIVTSYPGGGQMTIRLVLEEGSGRILGGQIVGSQKAGKRVDVLAALAQLHHTVHDLAKLDLAYAPPFATPWDALAIAAAGAINEQAKHG